ncbi:MAG: Nucleotidyltransferase domain protein [Candidatus Latescibacteria bacterium ADurb.Bin168]|nr:MAG: Nucleotidyltransferase domain protein [Candidatus Latescibacteria bacterium ADurb.Bin168]
MNQNREGDLLTGEQVLVVLSRHKNALAKRYRVNSLGVFGSMARGDSGPSSDVDIVFTTDSPNLFRSARMKLELERLLQRPVDIVRLRDNMNPRLKARILREARYV